MNDQVRRFHSKGQPTISVGAKKMDLIGDFKNPGREWCPAGDPETVRVHDLLIPAEGKAIPYGVYDLQRNEGWVSVGIDHERRASRSTQYDGGGSSWDAPPILARRTS